MSSEKKVAVISGAALVEAYRGRGYRIVVDAILYLESATFVTGETLHVDGGQSAGH